MDLAWLEGSAEAVIGLLAPLRARVSDSVIYLTTAEAIYALRWGALHDQGRN